jgi:hypothetical protein
VAADLSAASGGADQLVPFGVPGTPGEPILRFAARATSVEGVERELARIWSQPTARDVVAGPADRVVAARTSVLNLVVVARRPELGEKAVGLISMLTGRHPSRTLVLVPADPDGPGWFSARVNAYCMLPRADAPETCAELIYAAAGGETGRHLGAIVAPLLVHDLPVTLWWPGDPPFGSRLADDLIAMADRLVVDGSRWSGDGLERLRALALLGRQVAVSDFALVRQARWREAVASVYDDPEFLPYLRSLRRVAVTYATRGGPDTENETNLVKPIYHVAWLASRLDLRVRRPLERVARPAVRKPVPGAGPDPGRGLRARLAWDRGTDVEVVVKPIVSTMPGGTTLRVELLSDRRGSELRADVTAEAETVHIRVWQDGVASLERTFLAPRRTDLDLLAEAIESGGRDHVTADALAMAARLAGPGPGA